MHPYLVLATVPVKLIWSYKGTHKKCRPRETRHNSEKVLTKGTGQNSRMVLKRRERTGRRRVPNLEGRAEKLLIKGGQDRTQKIF